MAIKLPTITVPAAPKALFDILKLEGSPAALPASPILVGSSLAAYGAGAAGLQFFEHSATGALLYGVIVATFLSVATFLILHFTGNRDRLLQTLTALAATGAVMAIVTIFLHFVFGAALPPPLPSERLVRFLLFPVILWNVFMFAWVLRHAPLRTIPSFVYASCYVIVIDWILSPLLK